MWVGQTGGSFHFCVCVCVSFRSIHPHRCGGSDDGGWLPRLLWRPQRVAVHAGIGEELSFVGPHPSDKLLHHRFLKDNLNSWESHYPSLCFQFFFFLLVIFAVEVAAGVWGLSNKDKVSSAGCSLPCRDAVYPTTVVDLLFLSPSHSRSISTPRSWRISPNFTSRPTTTIWPRTKRPWRRHSV